MNNLQRVFNEMIDDRLDALDGIHEGAKTLQSVATIVARIAAQIGHPDDIERLRELTKYMDKLNNTAQAVSQDLTYLRDGAKI